MATHSSFLAWEIPWIEALGGLQCVGLQSRTRLKRLSSSSSSNFITLHSFPFFLGVGIVELWSLSKFGNHGAICYTRLCIASLRFIYYLLYLDGIQGFPGSASGKEFTCQCRRCQRCRFNLQVGKIPWRRKWQPTPVFLPGKFHGQRNLAGVAKELDMTQGLNHTSNS